MSFSIIAAVCEETAGIGINGKLPWDKIVGDMVHFKTLTDNSVVIMGRKTWESLPVKPLKNRVNIILSKNNSKNIKIVGDNTFVFTDFDEAIRLATNSFPDKKIYIIGGSDLYYMAIYRNECKNIHLTIINGYNHVQCDSFFPRVPEDDYEIDSESENICENGIRYKFVNYKRVKVSYDRNFCCICGDEMEMSSQVCSKCSKKF